MRRQFKLFSFQIASTGVLLASVVTANLAATLNFDRLHRLTGVDYGNGNSIQYSYDASGNMLGRVAIGTAVPDSVPLLIVVASEQQLPYTQASTSIQVSNGSGGVMHWTATVTSGQSWLSIVGNNSGTGFGVVQLLAAANPDTLSRGATVRVTSADAYNHYVDLLLAQAASPFVSTVPGAPVPNDFALRKNYPNPFNPHTAIEFGVPSAAVCSLDIYDVRGRLVTRLVGARSFEPGWHTVEWNGRDLRGGEAPSGVYLCQLVASGRRDVLRMILLR